MTLDPTIEARVRAKRAAPLEQDADALALLDEVERLRDALADEHAGRCADQLDLAGARALLAEMNRPTPYGVGAVDFLERLKKAEAERDRALAACAEMRAAAVGFDGRCRLCTASPREHRDSCALVFTRDEVVGGRVVLDGEEEARVQSALELVTSDPEADMLHATTRDAVSDALALLKGKVTT